MSRRYPRDEFDAVAPGSGRRGAHRARPNPLLPVLPVALVGGVVGLVGLAGVAVLGGGGDEATTDPGTVVAAATEPSGTEVEAVSADLGAEAAVVVTEPEPLPEPEPPAPAVVEPPSEPDPSVPLVVLNGTKTTGLAAKAASSLERQGWTVESTGNERSSSVTGTTVTYADADLVATAEAVADDLGAEPVLDPGAEDGVLTVVLGPGWTP